MSRPLPCRHMVTPNPGPLMSGCRVPHLHSQPQWTRLQCHLWKMICQKLNLLHPHLDERAFIFTSRPPRGSRLNISFDIVQVVTCILCMSFLYVIVPACIWLRCEFSSVYKLVCVFGVYSIVLSECPSVIYSSSILLQTCSLNHNKCVVAICAETILMV